MPSWAHSIRAQDLRQPDCPVLEQWVTNLNPTDTFVVAPKVVITGLLKDERTIPLFGSPVEDWNNDQFYLVGEFLLECRIGAVRRKDWNASRNLKKAMRAIDRASFTMQRATRMAVSATKSVQALLDYPSTPDLQKVIAMARDALKGINVRAKRASIKNAKARKALTYISDIERVSGFLTEKQRQSLITRLQKNKTAAPAGVKKTDHQ